MKLPINGGKITLKSTNSSLNIGDPNLTDAPTVTLTVNSTANSPTSGTNMTASITNNDASTVSITDLGGTIAGKGDFGLTVGQTINAAASLTDNTIAVTPGQSETLSVRVVAAGESRSTPLEVTLSALATPQISITTVNPTSATLTFSNIANSGVTVYATVNSQQKSRSGNGTIEWTGLTGGVNYSTSNVFSISTGLIPSATATNVSFTTGLETVATPTVTLTPDTDIDVYTTGQSMTLSITNNDASNAILNILDPGGPSIFFVQNRSGFDLVNGQTINASQTVTDSGISATTAGTYRFRSYLSVAGKNDSATITRTLSDTSSPGTITVTGRTNTSISYSFPTVPSDGKLWAELRLGTSTSGTLIERKSVAGPGPKTLTWTGLTPNTQYTVRAYNLRPNLLRSPTSNLTESTMMTQLSSPSFSSSLFTGSSTYTFSTNINNGNSNSVTAHAFLLDLNYNTIQSSTHTIGANSSFYYQVTGINVNQVQLRVYFSASGFLNSNETTLIIGVNISTTA
jgi:hypothetical protein